MIISWETAPWPEVYPPSRKGRKGVYIIEVVCVHEKPHLFLTQSVREGCTVFIEDGSACTGVYLTLLHEGLWGNPFIYSLGLGKIYREYNGSSFGRP